MIDHCYSGICKESLSSVENSVLHLVTFIGHMLITETVCYNLVDSLHPVEVQMLSSVLYYYITWGSIDVKQSVLVVIGIVT